MHPRDDYGFAERPRAAFLSNLKSELLSEIHAATIAHTQSIRRQHGSLHVTAKELHIHVKLGFLMAAFKNPIHDAVEKNLDSLIKPAVHHAAKDVEADKVHAKKPAAKARK